MALGRLRPAAEASAFATSVRDCGSEVPPRAHTKAPAPAWRMNLRRFKGRRDRYGVGPVQMYKLFSGPPRTARGPAVVTRVRPNRIGAPRAGGTRGPRSAR